MNNGIRWIFGFCVAACLLMVAAAIHLWGAAEVRRDPSELLLLTLIGAAWLIIAVKLFPWLGLSLRDDVVERRNVAALVAICGATTAVAILYVGGSLGEGPSYWDNFYSAALGTAGWLLLWIVLEMGGKVSISIAEERDVASGSRMGGFLLAIALVLGRALAGDWKSEAATVRDFFMMVGQPGYCAPSRCLLKDLPGRIEDARFHRGGDSGCCQPCFTSHLPAHGCGILARGKGCQDDNFTGGTM